MDRQIVYVGAIPLDSNILLTNRAAMIADGWGIQGILGTATQFTGLACTPTGPAGMTVNIAPGAVYSQQNVDDTAYGSLSPVTNQQIMKIGVNAGTLNFACPAPGTTGQSVVYLVEAAFVESDGGATVLPYYNAANPASPYAGPNNSGISQNTVRQDICSVRVKVGVAATTGTQAIPAPDAGYTSLYAVTVAFGQTTITSGNISVVGGAPFISEVLGAKLSQATADIRYAQITAVQNNAYTSAIDSSGTPNVVTVTLSPVPPAGIQTFMLLNVQIANNNNGATTLNVNGTGAKSITINGNALTGGELKAGQNALLSYNGATWNLFSQSKATTNVYAGTAATTGTINAQVLAAVTPAGFSLTYGNVVTFTAGAALTNTGATTINVSSTGAITIKKQSGSGLVDLAAGDITATDTYQIIYDGVYWELFSSSFPPPSTFFQVANNLSEGNATTMRANLGLGSVAVLNTSAVLQTANALSELAATAATARTNLGLGSAAVQAVTAFLQRANNLSDILNLATAIANLGFSASVGATGYIKFPAALGGLIIQWGFASVGDDQLVTVSLPIAFPNNFYRVISSVEANGIPLGQNHTMASAAWPASLSTVNLYYSDSSSSPFAPVNVPYIAIGN